MNNLPTPYIDSRTDSVRFVCGLPHLCEYRQHTKEEDSPICCIHHNANDGCTLNAAQRPALRLWIQAYQDKLEELEESK